MLLHAQNNGTAAATPHFFKLLVEKRSMTSSHLVAQACHLVQASDVEKYMLER
jgi:hypothetical protein